MPTLNLGQLGDYANIWRTRNAFLTDQKGVYTGCVKPDMDYLYTYQTIHNEEVRRYPCALLRHSNNRTGANSQAP